MAATSMNHFTVLTDDVDGTIRFYGELLGLARRDRGPISIFPAHGCTRATHRYCTSSAARPKAELRAGVIDHMAFTGRDLPATLAALEARGIEHTCRRQVSSGTWQVFFHDPNGARVELDFDASESAPGR